MSVLNWKVSGVSVRFRWDAWVVGVSWSKSERRLHLMLHVFPCVSIYSLWKVRSWKWNRTKAKGSGEQSEER